jgi:large subunit ribosomal protein L6
MSRIGKKPVIIPAGVTAKVDGQAISVKGGKGELSFTAPDNVSVALAEDKIVVTPRNDSTQARGRCGARRGRCQQSHDRRLEGFERKLEITGVGYKAVVSGKSVRLSASYSHDVNFPIPAGIAIVAPKPTEISITGIDKRQVGQTAAEIRALRPPEPYKGKGVKYAGEFIFRKEGKKK